MILINFILSLIFGMIPEVLYFTLFLKFTKNIDKHIVKLFVLLAIGYVALIMICRYEFLFYIMYIIYSYLVLKVLYKSEIIDIFVYSIAFSYLMIVGYTFKLLLFNNYVLYYLVVRVFMFLPFIFKNKFNQLYILYRKLWNIRKGNKIKSLTIRNSSLIFVNSMISTIYVIIVFVLNDF